MMGHRILTISRSRTTTNMLKAKQSIITASSSPSTMPQRRFVQPLFKSTRAISTSTSILKPWPKPMIESKGDYRDEAFLEEYIGGSLYKNQKSIPRLPIPEIPNTLSTFLPTALPLTKNSKEQENLIAACEAFPKQAATLHQRLVERKSGEMKDSSWLQLWWNTAGYLQVRDPVVVNVSYFFHFSDDTTLPQSHTTLSRAIKRGAAILVATAEFRNLVCSGSLPCETIGRKVKTPLCSTAFKYMFNACRIPRKEIDTYKIYDPSQYGHVVVAVKGNFYAVDFLDNKGMALPLETIEEELQYCVDMAEADAKERSGLNLGSLTSHDRESWAEAREELLNAGGEKMKRALERLESGAILLCLDVDETPVSRKQCGNLFWTGGVTSGHNRWFDKSIQIMVASNGKAGLIGEHSMMDGK